MAPRTPRPTPPRRLALALAVAAVALVGAACADDPLPDATRPPSTDPGAVLAEPPVAVTIFAGAVDPDPLRVPAGTTVTWVNDPIEEEDHWLVSREPGVFDTATLRPGNSYSQTLHDPGTYEYFCRIHPELTGVVEVH